MNPDQIRRKLDDLGRKRARAQRHLADARAKQARKNSDALSYRSRADRSSSASSARQHLRQAESAERAASREEGRVAAETRRIADLARQEASLTSQLSTALRRQASSEDKAQRRQAEEDRRARERERRAERARTEALIGTSEDRLSTMIAEVRPPKPERLRILYLTAAPAGDLRVDKEIRRVKRGVQAATHRDLVEIEHMPAATPSDLLDGVARFRPHVVHFSGHANRTVLAFDTEADTNNPGQDVTTATFGRAIAALDEPPTLVVLNACESEAHLTELLTVVPLAIGMADSVDDEDAMAFAARFYAAVAESQSVESAFEAARVQMELNGLPDTDLPVLASRQDLDPRRVHLVIVPPE